MDWRQHPESLRGWPISLPLSQCLDALLEVRFFAVEVVRPIIPIRIAHIIKIVSLRRVQRRIDRGLSGISDRARRQSRVQTSVVRRLAIDVAQVNSSVITPFTSKL